MEAREDSVPSSTKPGHILYFTNIQLFLIPDGRGENFFKKIVQIVGRLESVARQNKEEVFRQVEDQIASCILHTGNSFPRNRFGTAVVKPTSDALVAQYHLFRENGSPAVGVQRVGKPQVVKYHREDEKHQHKPHIDKQRIPYRQHHECGRHQHNPGPIVRKPGAQQPPEVVHGRYFAGLGGDAGAIHNDKGYRVQRWRIFTERSIY